jgi:predicted membrane protein
MEQNENDFQQYHGRKNPRIWSGLLLVAAGVLLLAYKMGAPVPHWIFTWPVLLIGFGLLAGFKSRFHNPGSFIMIVVGCIFLIDQTNPELKFHNYILPVILISIGLIYILRPRNSWSGKWRRARYRMHYDSSSPANPTTLNYIDSKNNAQEDNSEYVEINTAFGSVKKIILSKNFRGGEISNFMGGTEINLMKADIQNPIQLEVNNVFGGAKLIVPSNWDVKNEVTAVFGGIEDKRAITTGIADPGKVMVLKGTCVFGGIEITNY